MNELNSPEDVLKQVEEIKKWEPSVERSMALKALGSILLKVTYGKQFKPGFFFDMDTYLGNPGFFERIFHLIFCHWVEYDDNNSFDATKQVCLICGRTQSSIMARSYAYMEDTSPDFSKSEIKELREYLERCRREVEG